MPNPRNGHTLVTVKLTTAFIFFVLLLISFLIFAGVWHSQIAGTYFVGLRTMPGDFIPPFIHPGASGNFYIKPLRVIYAVWSLYATFTLLVPAAITWVLVRLHQRALDHSSWR